MVYLQTTKTEGISKIVPITIPDLQKIVEDFAEQQYTFKDLQLDIRKDENFNKVNEAWSGVNDIGVSYDAAAIKNSIKNIFNTRPGQRFLFPLFGLDLYQFLFTTVSEQNAKIIGETIISSLEKYEPRIYIRNCLVEQDPEQNVYFINLNIEIPNLTQTFNFYSALDLKKQSFIFFENSRNR